MEDFADTNEKPRRSRKSVSTQLYIYICFKQNI